MMKTRGFTMIEFLLVMALIGILGTLGLSSYTKSLRRSRDAKRIEDMQAIQKGFELYYAKHDAYAPCDDMANDDELFPSGLPEPPAGTLTYTYSANCGSSGAYCVCTGLEIDTYANSAPNCDFGDDALGAKNSYCVENLQ